MSTAREEVLGRIRAALATPAPAPPLESPPAPAVDGGGDASSRRSTTTGVVNRQLDDPEARVVRFVERVEDYRATVTRCVPDEVAATVELICARQAVATLAVPDGVPTEWVPGGVDVVPIGTTVDADVVRALDAVDGVLTACALAVAETGTIVLDGGPAQGPRAATLVPDLHVCIVPAEAVVPGVPELTVRMEELVREHGRPITLISGPSATSDIELDRVEGVHGPRRLEVVVVGDVTGGTGATE